MISNPFIAEMIRIIKEESPEKYGPKTIVLTSYRFFHAAREAVLVSAGVFGKGSSNPELTTYNYSALFVSGVVVCPAPWLSDYEFEIRPEQQLHITSPSRN